MKKLLTGIVLLANLSAFANDDACNEAYQCAIKYSGPAQEEMLVVGIASSKLEAAQDARKLCNNLIFCISTASSTLPECTKF